jgi:DNA-binding NarL/FixJ family response regulator
MAKRILIVDDTQFMRKMLADCLVQNGYAVAGEAGNGREAIRQYNELRPDLVVMDINMPEMGGIEAIREILKLDPGAVILICTASKQQEHINEAMREGAKGFILKPFNLGRVIEIIGKFTNSRLEPENQQRESEAAPDGEKSEATVESTVEATAEADQHQAEAASPNQSEMAQDEPAVPAAKQENVPAAALEESPVRVDGPLRRERGGNPDPFRRRKSMQNFVSSVMCNWMEERDGETALFTVVCTESENKVLVEMSVADREKQTMQFSLDCLLHLGSWLEDHVENSPAASEQSKPL